LCLYLLSKVVCEGSEKRPSIQDTRTSLFIHRFVSSKFLLTSFGRGIESWRDSSFQSNESILNGTRPRK
jgi:hypothetical protein